MNSLTNDEMEGYCTWLIATLGGAGYQHYCYDYVVTVATVSECVSTTADTNFGTCTVGDLEMWVASEGSACNAFFGNDPACFKKSKLDFGLSLMQSVDPLP